MDDLKSSLRRAVASQEPASSDFDLNPNGTLPAGRKLRAAGVLVAVTQIKGVAHLILTKRSSALQHHPGQIAFPGGKRDDTDPDVTFTALREAHEEIGLPPEQVTVLGHLSEHETVTAFNVTPVLAIVNGSFDIKPEPGEVEEVFTVPLAHVLNPDNYVIESRRWLGERRHYFAVPYGPYYIWGATARMLRALAARMEK